MDRCIGEQLAYVQLNTVLAAMVRGFKLRREKDVVPTDYSVSCTDSLLVFFRLTIFSLSLFSRPQWPKHLNERNGPSTPDKTDA